MPLSSPRPFTELLVLVFLNVHTAYVLFAALAFWIFHRWTPRWLLSRRIGPGPVSSTQVRRELLSSVTSLIIIGLMGLAMYGLAQSGMSRLYSDNRYGAVWFVVSIPVMLVIHDTYFYWMHRFMHWKPVFKHVHRLHHMSRDPSPLCAFTLNPLEVLLEMTPPGLIMMTLPVHDSAFLLFVTFQVFVNIIGHLGFELYPKSFVRSPLGKLFNSTTYHHLHHHKPDTNYSFYFNFWDRLMGTNHPHYEATFETVVNRAPMAGQSPKLASQSE